MKTTKKTASKKNPVEYVLPKGKALVLRTCNSDMTSHGGFKWPKSGKVECSDWSPYQVCGKGLHGLLWGEGEGSLLGEFSCPHLVVEIDEASKVDLHGKVKFSSGAVVHCGDAKSATDFIRDHGGRGRSIVRGTSTSGYEGTSTSGDKGTSTSGVRGTSTSGYEGTSTSGDWGTSTSGYGGTSTSGVRGTSTSGYGGTSNTGSAGIVVCRWWDSKAERARLTIGYVGEDGVKPDTFYRCNDKGKLVEVK